MQTQRFRPADGDPLAAAAAKITQCVDQLTSHTDTLVRDRHTRHASATSGPPSPCDAAVFEIKLLTSRMGEYAAELITAAKDSQRRAAAAMSELRGLATANVALEAKLRRSASLDTPGFASLTTPATPPVIPVSAPHTDHGEGCGCGKGDCEHKKQLASHIIDRTFDDHRRVLRGRLAALEKEVEELRSGAGVALLRDELKKKQALLDAKDRELDEANRKWVDARTRMMAARVAPAADSGAGQPVWVRSDGDGNTTELARLRRVLSFAEIQFERCTLYPVLCAHAMLQWAALQQQEFADAVRTLFCLHAPALAQTQLTNGSGARRREAETMAAIPSRHFHRTGGGYYPQASPREAAGYQALSVRRQRESLQLTHETEGVLGTPRDTDAAKRKAS
jgi:hypothetical protein